MGHWSEGSRRECLEVRGGCCFRDPCGDGRGSGRFEELALASGKAVAGEQVTPNCAPEVPKPPVGVQEVITNLGVGGVKT